MNRTRLGHDRFGHVNHWLHQQPAMTHPVVPIVGEGATEIGKCDRTPWTIIKVGKTSITVQRDTVWVFSQSGHGTDITPNHLGETIVLRKRPDGRWGNRWRIFLIGFREAFRDPML